MKILIVIPCYNEAEVLPQTLDRMQIVMQRLQARFQAESKLLLVDDGSKDQTWSIISEHAERYANVSGLRLAHNSGHQTALWAGMEAAVGHCDAVVSIDADLQDDEMAIEDMVQQAAAGADIVYGVRRKRATDTWFKRTSAKVFYRLMNLFGADTIENHADFRLLSARALEALMQYPERNLFIRGLVRKLGFSEQTVYYDRKARQAGETKYPLRRMLQFSVDGITSFSTVPLRLITLGGLAMVLISLCMIGFALVRYFMGETIQGWTSLLVSLWFIGGVVTTGIGICGTYIGKIYTEVKRRPRYFIAETTGDAPKAPSGSLKGESLSEERRE